MGSTFGVTAVDLCCRPPMGLMFWLLQRRDHVTHECGRADCWQAMDKMLQQRRAQAYRLSAAAKKAWYRNRAHLPGVAPLRRNVPTITGRDARHRVGQPLLGRATGHHPAQSPLRGPVVTSVNKTGRRGGHGRSRARTNATVHHPCSLAKCLGKDASAMTSTVAEHRNQCTPTCAFSS